MNLNLDDLIEGYLNGTLDAEKLAALNARMEESRAVRDEFRARCRIHGVLAEYFSDTGDAFAPIGRRAEPRRNWGLVLSIAAVLAALLAAVSLFLPAQGERMSAIRIEGSRDAVWATSVGELLPTGPVRLLSGLVELKIGEGVRVAIEGPAEFEVLGPKRLRLDRGNIAADVEEAGHGFTVVTPEGEVIDFGTRFGVRVDAGGRSEAHVFEGEVEVVSGSGKLRLHDDEAADFQELLPLDAEPWSFPQPAQELVADVAPASFEPGQVMGAGMPGKAAEWSGDACRIVARSADGSLRPARGSGMLQFLATYSAGAVGAGDQRASEIWQIVDLRPFSDQVNAGEVTASLRASFNRTSGSENSQFKLGMNAFRGRQEEAESFWDRKNELTSERLASTGSVILSDDDPATWEPLEIGMPVPPGTDFLLIDLLAFENETWRDRDEFAGHFVDAVDFHLSARARKSIPRSIWAGREGRWHHPSNWEDGLPDPQDIIVIRGEGVALIDRKTGTKQTVIIADHNDSVGRLRVAPNAEFVKSGFGQMIIGYNPGARAELIVQGSLVTRSPVCIGRNNAESVVDLDGGSWDAGDGTIRMSQYGGDKFPDTRSVLRIRNGGRLEGRALEMIHDVATMEIEDGTVEIGTLQLGGDDGEALVRLGGGELRLERLVFGRGSGRFEFRSDAGTLFLKGRWTPQQIIDMPGADWRVGTRPAAIDDFEIQEAGAFSKISLRSRNS